MATQVRSSTNNQKRLKLWIGERAYRLAEDGRVGAAECTTALIGRGFFNFIRRDSSPALDDANPDYILLGITITSVSR